MDQKQRERVETVYSKYKDGLDFDIINKTIDLSGNRDLPQISKTTLQNISNWALNGASNREIAQNLEISEKQFKTLCALCPTIMYLMSDSRELADIVIAGSLFQRAVGGQKIHKIVPVKIGDYNADGKKIAEHIEMVEQEEELPPDPMLLKFLATHKLSEKFGADKDNIDEQVAGTIDKMSEEQLELVERQLNGK